MPSLDTLIAHLGVQLSNRRLVESALVHSSLMNERPERTVGLASSERLEFLGDAVLNFLAAEQVYQRFPEASEGELTLLRSALIKTDTLAGLAREYDLGAYLRLSKGEEQSGARDRDALLADTFEAVVAAIFLDGGVEATRAFLSPIFSRLLDEIDANGITTDYKSRLQRRIQGERNITPRYQVTAEEGPEHHRLYTVEVLVDGQQIGLGSGHGKQAAAQAAARAALESLDGQA